MRKAEVSLHILILNHTNVSKGGKFEIIVTVTTIQNRPIEELILNIPLNSGIAIIDSNCNIGNVVLDPSNQVNLVYGIFVLY
jgi:hypothetical protein